MGDEPIFHLTEVPVWHDAVTTGRLTESTRGRRLEEVGFIHCSYRSQVETVAGFVYADVTGELLLLEIDPDRVPSQIRVEAAPGTTDHYPHVYGPVPVEAVTAVRTMNGDGGQWQLPEDLASGT
jgi:glutathione S-transferase